MSLIAAFVALLFLHSLVSRRLESTIVTAPIVFMAAGILAVQLVPEAPQENGGPGLFLTVAEIGLVLLLFTDASRTELGMLGRIRNLPVRLLSIGMLLSIALGAIVARLIFPQLSWAEAGVLGAILAPTDAGLGQIIVNSPRVPMKIRQALNVEAGLNDGLSVPFLLFFIALGGEASGASLGRFVLEQLGFGVLVGLGVGLVGGWLLGSAQRNEWMAHSWQQLGVVALPLIALLVSESVGASMFIAAFVGGLAVQVGFKEAGTHSVEFTEQWGQVFNLSVFFLFGMLVARNWAVFQWSHAAYAIVSLTFVRMVPVALALLGTRLHRATVLFMGWFGPRGLASIVLGMVYVEEVLRPPVEPDIRLAVIATVLLSVLAHGFSALPGMKLYAHKLQSLPPGAPELEIE